MPLLVDLEPVPCCHTDSLFDGLYKALAEDPHGDEERSIWAHLPNPWVAGHVEDVTNRFQRILEALQDAFSRALTGESIGVLAKAEPWERWDQSAMDAARLHLELVPPSHYSLDDWLMLCDWLISRYIPEGAIRDMGDYLTIRSYLAGKISSNLEARDKGTLPGPEAIEELVSHDFGKLPDRALTQTESAVLGVAKARAALNISDLTAKARISMKRIVVEHVQAMVLGHKEGTPDRLRQRLFDTFGTLNRDFRRIAVTEAGEAANTGFIASCAPGTKVRRIEAYRGACPFCRSINGRVYTVVAPDHEPKDGETQVWVGKSNVGRSASPRRRVGNELVDREPEELWWCASGVMHPNCRGSWAYVSGQHSSGDQEFDNWMDGILEKHRTKKATGE